MNRRLVFVIVPSLTNSGPIRGAVALCRSLAPYLPITLVPLKAPQGCPLRDVPDIPLLSLDNCETWWAKRRLYREALTATGDKEKRFSISFCFSADVFNASMSRYAVVIASVRGNLMKNYCFDYGLPGRILTLLHFMVLRRFDKVIAMSSVMARQLNRFGISKTVTIGNFLDEIQLESLRITNKSHSGVVRFISLASLSSRKCPDLLIESMRILHEQGMECSLDLVGDGPLRGVLEERVRELGLNSRVSFHGYLDKPYEMLQKADCLVLPSASEGASRAAMEALYFGLPCILRDVDSNRDMICPGKNGLLFDREEELATAMATMASELNQTRQRGRTNLLPAGFRQRTNVEAYLNLILR